MVWVAKRTVAALFCTDVPAPAAHMMGVTLPLLVKSGTCLTLGSWVLGFLCADLSCAEAFPDMTFWSWPAQFVAQTGPEPFIFSTITTLIYAGCVSRFHGNECRSACLKHNSGLSWWHCVASLFHVWRLHRFQTLSLAALGYFCDVRLQYGWLEAAENSHQNVPIRSCWHESWFSSVKRGIQWQWLVL